MNHNGPLSLVDLSINPELARAETLPSAWYTDPAALLLERDGIFRRSWQYAGPAAAVAEPGSFLTTTIGEAPVVILRDAEGTLRAFYNVCRHRAGPIAQGAGRCRRLTCSYHGWTYDLRGQLLGTPEFGGVANFSKSEHGLVPVAVAEFGPLLFAHLGGGEPGLAEVLGTIPSETAALRLGELRLYREVTYELACNWKVYVDNYLEPYHLPHVHPGLTRELDYPAYKTDVFTYYSRQWAPVRAQTSLYRRGLAQEAAPEALYYWLFPNLMFNIYPDNLQINVIRPLGGGRTATYFAWFLPGNAGEQEFQRSFAFSDAIQQEDIAICEQVQKGLATPAYHRGRYSVERENGLHHFHLLYAQFLQEAATRG